MTEPKSPWPNPLHRVADEARNKALNADCNDQMSALAEAVDAATALIRDTFLSMLAEAREFTEEVDGEYDDEGRPNITVDYKMLVRHHDLEEFCTLIGISSRPFGKALYDVIKDELEKMAAADRKFPIMEGGPNGD